MFYSLAMRFPWESKSTFMGPCQNALKGILLECVLCHRTRAANVEMKLDCCVFLWKLSFLKTLEITTPLKSGPYGARPLIFNS
jgi:hypothetical protein